jgi:hypothetical protein
MFKTMCELATEVILDKYNIFTNDECLYTKEELKDLEDEIHPLMEEWIDSVWGEEGKI